VHQVAIIGAGQLGSRHLQALASLDRGHHITVVEPVAECVERAQSRWKEVATDASPNVSWAREVEALPDAVDVAVVATAAEGRRALLENLLGKASVKHLVVEKVLFQRIADYAPMAATIAAATTTAWVNCPRRMWTFYQRLRERTTGPLRLTVSGSQWGLGSAAVHFQDLFDFLGGGDSQHIDSLHASMIPSRRSGYSELVGELSGHSERGSFSFASLAEGNVPVCVEVSSPSLRAIVREGEGKAWVAAAADNWSWNEEAVDVIPQSKLTGRIAADLITTGTCGLTPLASSVKHHVSFLQVLAQNLGVDVCPIT
jgi:hypothetical protein